MTDLIRTFPVVVVLPGVWLAAVAVSRGRLSTWVPAIGVVVCLLGAAVGFFAPVRDQPGVLLPPLFGLVIESMVAAVVSAVLVPLNAIVQWGVRRRGMRRTVG